MPYLGLVPGTKPFKERTQEDLISLREDRLKTLLDYRDSLAKKTKRKSTTRRTTKKKYPAHIRKLLKHLSPEAKTTFLANLAKA